MVQAPTNSALLKAARPPFAVAHRRISERDYSKAALIDGIEAEIKRLWWWLQLLRNDGVGWHVPTDHEPMKRATRDALTSLLSIRRDATGTLSYWGRREQAAMAADLDAEVSA